MEENMVSIIAAAILAHKVTRTGHCECGTRVHPFALPEDVAAHQARAVLAAIEQAGGVEWGVQYERLGLDGAETHILETANKSHAGSVAELAQPSIGWNHRVASRITGPWERAE